MKKGFMLPFLIIGLIGLSVFYIATFSTIYPNQKTQETSQAIPKYANNTSWQITNDKIPCMFNFGNCLTPPSKILFSTEDSWPSIYDAYKTNMGDFGWKTNSRIVTSTPTSIVFENEEGCTADLTQNETVFREKDRESEKKTYNYLFTVICKN